MANSFQSLSLRDTYGAGVADRQAQQLGEQQKSFNALRMDQAKQEQELAGRRQTLEERKFSSEQQLANTEWLVGAGEQVLANPQLYGTLVAEGKKRGIISPDFNAPFDPNAIETIVGQARVSLGQAMSGQAPSELQTFNAMTQGLSQDEVALARKINLGLSSRAGQSRVTDIGGIPHLVGTMESGQPFAIPMSSLEKEIGASSQQKEAEALGAGRGKAQAEREAAAPKEAQRQATKFESTENVIGVIDRAIENSSFWTTGLVGSQAAKVAGTPAFDLAQDLETIKANIGFDRLQRMREESKTGGALGQVAVQELVALQATIRSLEQAQSKDQFVDNLQAVKLQYGRAMQAYDAAQQEASMPKPGDVVDGYEYIGGDPSRQESWKKQ